MLTLAVKIDVKPRPGQSQADAEARMAELVSDYLTQPEMPFMEDYGPEAWGGWPGPFVTDVSVTRE